MRALEALSAYAGKTIERVEYRDSGKAVLWFSDGSMLSFAFPAVV